MNKKRELSKVCFGLSRVVKELAKETNNSRERKTKFLKYSEQFKELGRLFRGKTSPNKNYE